MLVLVTLIANLLNTFCFWEVVIMLANGHNLAFYVKGGTSGVSVQEQKYKTHNAILVAQSLQHNL